MSLVGERWQTIHSNWNMELFSNLFGTPRDLGRNMKYLNGIIDKIFSIKNEDIAFAVLGTIYKMPEIGLLTFDYVESISIPNFIGDKKKASLIARLGESYHLKDQNHRALGKLDTAYSLDRNNFYVCNVFGMTLKTMREIPGAIEMFREVLRLSPESIIVNINLAEALSMNGEYPEAIAILENLIEIYSKKNDSQSLSSLYNNLGLNYYRQAQDEEAEKNYKLSLSFYEDDLPYKNLALTRFANRDFSKAIEYCDKVLELFPDDAYALEWKINSLMMEGSEEKTVKVFRKLRKIEPELYTTMKNFYRRPDWKQFFEKNYLR